MRELGATPIDYQREDFTRVLPGGFDVVFDGIGEHGFRRSFAALKRGGLLYSAGVQAQRRMLTILMWMARLYLWKWLPGGKRARIYSINVMRGTPGRYPVHGINPAMGWLFAVALGLNRRNRKIVLLSLVPLALGQTPVGGNGARNLRWVRR
jgi:hypothetical protein